MAFVIEWIITHFLELFINKHFGWNEHHYKELLNSTDKFVFNKQNKIYLIIRLMIVFLMLLATICFFAIYFYGLYHNESVVYYIRNNHLIQVRYDQELGLSAWSFLLFGIFFLADTYEEFSELFKKYYSKLQKLNHWYSCFISYYVTLIITCILRVGLMFGLDNAVIICNSHYSLNPLMFGLMILYNLSIIASLLILVLTICLLLTHSHLKPEFLTSCLIKHDKLKAHLQQKSLKHYKKITTKK